MSTNHLRMLDWLRSRSLMFNRPERFVWTDATPMCFYCPVCFAKGSLMAARNQRNMNFQMDKVLISCMRPCMTYPIRVICPLQQQPSLVLRMQVLPALPNNWPLNAGLRFVRHSPRRPPVSGPAAAGPRRDLRDPAPLVLRASTPSEAITTSVTSLETTLQGG